MIMIKLMVSMLIMILISMKAKSRLQDSKRAGLSCMHVLTMGIDVCGRKLKISVIYTTRSYNKI